MFYRNKNKTVEYRNYQDEVRDYAFLDNPVWPFGTEPVEFTIEVGLSSKLADLDNVLKPLFDTYQSIYEEFDDKTVYKITATKELVIRGDEYLAVIIQPYCCGATRSEVSAANSTDQEDES